MNRFRRQEVLRRLQEAPWWYSLMLWGPGVPLVALCWGLAYIVYMGLPMVTAAPLLLLAAFAWLVRLPVQPMVTPPWDESSKERIRRLLLRLAVMLLTTWLLLFVVGKQFLTFAAMPLFLLIWAYIPFVSRLPGWRKAFHAVAMALACATPASFLCMTVVPLQLFSFSPTWYLAVLFFLYYLVRAIWQLPEDHGRKRRIWSIIGLALFCACCLVSGAEAPYILEKALCFTIALAAGNLLMLTTLRPRLSEEVLTSLGWLALALPPLLGMGIVLLS